MSGEKIRDLRCSGCGARLIDHPSEDAVHCANCGKRHDSILPPPAEAEAPRLEPGDPVAVKWGEKWWPATVTQRKDDLWRVHYEGWGPAFDEDVPRHRIRTLEATDAGRADVHPISTGSRAGGKPWHSMPAIRIGGLSLILIASLLAGYHLWPSSVEERDIASETRAAAMGGPAQVPPSTRPLSSEDALTRNQAVYIYWDNAWYKGRVVSIRPNGDIEVHYDGWDDAYDEVVSPGRVRLPD